MVEMSVESPQTPSSPDPGVEAGNTSTGSGGLADSTEKSFALSDDVMWSDLDEVQVPQEASPTPPEQPSAQPSEGEAPKPAQAAQQPTQQTPQEKPQATPPAQAAPSQQPSAPQAAQPAPPQGAQAFNLQGELQKYRGEIISELATKRFALTPEESKGLEEDAIGAIPKLLARVYYEAATTAINQIHNMVPRIVEHVSNDMRTTNAAEDAFYAKWPMIDRTAHAGPVQVAANIFRQSFPQATREQAIEGVGRMVTSMLGLQAQAQAPQGARPNGNGVAPRPRPFSPASGGGRVTSQQALQPDPWAGMGANFDE